ncbi:unnamed protein product [Amoebophrya sp. A25]|nr:unnamed protein product [Amoebophrya sp. A25]|eukprot:GSA25T00022515001.1
MAPKAKKKTISLNEFAAEEFEKNALPTASEGLALVRAPKGGKKGDRDGGGGFGGGGKGGRDADDMAETGVVARVLCEETRTRELTLETGSQRRNQVEVSETATGEEVAALAAEASVIEEASAIEVDSARTLRHSVRGFN